MTRSNRACSYSIDWSYLQFYRLSFSALLRFAEPLFLYSVISGIKYDDDTIFSYFNNNTIQDNTTTGKRVIEESSVPGMVKPTSLKIYVEV